MIFPEIVADYKNIMVDEILCVGNKFLFMNFCWLEEIFWKHFNIMKIKRDDLSV